MEKITFLPVGSIEEHGVLPPDTDTIISQAFCVLAGEKLDATTEEPINKGFCPTTSSLVGTKAFRFEETFQRVAGRLKDLIDEARRYIVIINIHSGNEAVLTAVVQDIYIEQGFPILYFNPYTAFAGELDQRYFDGRDNSFKECSLLQGALDILGRALVSGPNVDEPTQRDRLVEKLKKVAVLGYSYRRVADHVAWRAESNGQAGRKFLEETLERFVPLIDDFKQYVETELGKTK